MFPSQRQCRNVITVLEELPAEHLSSEHVTEPWEQAPSYDSKHPMQLRQCEGRAAVV
jgi:hypothetical protein